MIFLAGSLESLFIVFLTLAGRIIKVIRKVLRASLKERERERMKERVRLGEGERTSVCDYLCHVYASCKH